jgi:parvulin-like peptidyl-prolyl isomerase
MKNIKFLFCILFFTGCSIFQPNDTALIQPKLLKQSALPAFMPSLAKDRFDIYCEMLINENGDVEKVKLLTRSGDPIWDSLATLSILTWKFSPAIADNRPVKLLVRRKFIVSFEKPKVMALAEIQIKDKTLVDSVYKALLNGSDYAALALKYSLSPSGKNKGVLGNVDINHYSKDIGNILSNLEVGEFTEPLNYGKYYIIFKRLKPTIKQQ